MSIETIGDIPFDVPLEDVINRMRLGRKAPAMRSMVKELYREVRGLAKPKALFKASFTGGRTERGVEIDGVEFTSGLLATKLENTERVFPYVVTAGRELDAIGTDKNDVMRVFLIDALKELVLENALRYFERLLADRLALGTMSHMNPGSLNDWPISQQKVLFGLFGDVEKLIGVRLTPSYLMDPIKSVSGIYFPTEIRFESCMLCSRERCPKRRATYDPEKAKEYKKANE
ncbi:MAG: vitamin B12 dependent methionine synthase [Spirochaetes bacterium]|nr:vitamin B12 dependent methionine synthase [Spirochaetota bacterium]